MARQLKIYIATYCCAPLTPRRLAIQAADLSDAQQYAAAHVRLAAGWVLDRVEPLEDIQARVRGVRP